LRGFSCFANASFLFPYPLVQPRQYHRSVLLLLAGAQGQHGNRCQVLRERWHGLGTPQLS